MSLANQGHEKYIEIECLSSYVEMYLYVSVPTLHNHISKLQLHLPIAF